MGVLSRGHVEEHQPPLTVPQSRPAFLRVAPAQDVQPPLRREPIQPVLWRTGVAFQQLLPLQNGGLAQEAVAIGPAFVGVGQVAKRRACEQVGRPEQEVQKFLGLGLHERSMSGRRRKRNASFCCMCNKSLSWGRRVCHNPFPPFTFIWSSPPKTAVRSCATNLRATRSTRISAASPNPASAGPAPLRAA